MGVNGPPSGLYVTRRWGFQTRLPAEIRHVLVAGDVLAGFDLGFGVGVCWDGFGIGVRRWAFVLAAEEGTGVGVVAVVGFLEKAHFGCNCDRSRII